MDTSISTAELRSALHRVQGIIQPKGSMPILSCVQLEAENTPAGGRITVRATDLEIGSISSHPCEVKKEGALAISAKALHDVARALPESTTRLKVGANNRLEVTSGAASFRLAGMPADDYPAIAESKGMEYCPVDRHALRSGLDRVVHAMSSDATRYNLNGVLFDFSEKGLSLVTTDGHRLSLTQLEKFSAPKPTSIIVGRKAVTELRKLLAEETSAPGEFAFNTNSISYKRAGLIFVARLVDGSFPDYTQVIPKAETSGVTVPRSMVEVLRRVMLLSDAAVTMELNSTGMVLSTRSAEVGEATDTVPVEYDGKPLIIALNGHYLMDVLGAVESATVQMHVEDDMSPVLIRPADGSLTAVLMPMRR